MATTGPTFVYTPHPPHNPHASRHHVYGHEAEPRMRSILLSGGSRSAASARNGDQEAASRTDNTPALTGTRERRTPARTPPGVAAGQRDEHALGGTERRSSSEGESAEARPSSSASTSASIHLEEDLAAALASTPTPEPTMSHRRPHMSLELPAHEPGAGIDVLYDADHKLALEGTSPKPCIVPGNALHLIDDDPDAPRSQTPSSIIIVAGEGDEGIFDAEGDVDGERESTGEDGRATSQPPGGRPAVPRVRFRSRVRITSGVHRHRHSITANGTPTPCSSVSDSPSSSISAPLRYQADEHGAWGPLGKRLSAYAAGGGWPRRTPVSQQQQVQVAPLIGPAPGGRARGGKTARSYNERTPLIRPGRQRSYTEETEEDEEARAEELAPEERALRAAALRREEEAVFGKWPWRIFNRHWWWWHVEPVLCCCCADDSDYEEF